MKLSIVEFILYPDSTSYDCDEVMNRIISDERFGRWAYALHDKDIAGIDDNGVVVEKKPHYHVMCQGKALPSGQFGNMTLKTLKELYPEAQIEKGKTSFRAMVRYLVHVDAPDKVLYPLDYITSNFNHAIYFKDRDNMAKASMISSYIIENNVTDVVQLLDYVYEKGLYSEFVRGGWIWREMMKSNRDRKARR